MHMKAHTFYMQMPTCKKKEQNISIWYEPRMSRECMWNEMVPWMYAKGKLHDDQLEKQLNWA